MAEAAVAELAATKGGRWFLDAVAGEVAVTEAAVVEHFHPSFLDAVDGPGTAFDWVARMAAGLQIVEPVTEDGGRLRVALRPVGSIPRFRVLLSFEDDGRISGFDFGPLEVEGIDFQAQRTDGLAADDLAALHRVFDATYRDADHEYLDESIAHLDTVVLGRHGDEVAGFALGAWRSVELPRLTDPQVVKLAGLACVDPAFRRRGLASRLGELAIGGGDARAEDTLFAGRMAHPASYRQASARIGAVPRPDRPPNAWQRQVGRIVADLYGVRDFEDETFVCRGRRRSIGEPIVEVEVAEEEWKVFAPVDRARGETLLAIWWGGDPGPDGWIEVDR
jgi:hypothetical protein